MPRLCVRLIPMLSRGKQIACSDHLQPLMFVNSYLTLPNSHGGRKLSLVCLTKLMLRDGELQKVDI